MGSLNALYCGTAAYSLSQSRFLSSALALDQRQCHLHILRECKGLVLPRRPSVTVAQCCKELLKIMDTSSYISLAKTFKQVPFIADRIVEPPQYSSCVDMICALFGSRANILWTLKASKGG